MHGVMTRVFQVHKLHGMSFLQILLITTELATWIRDRQHLALEQALLGRFGLVTLEFHPRQTLLKVLGVIGAKVADVAQIPQVSQITQDNSGLLFEPVILEILVMIFHLCPSQMEVI